MGEKCSPPLVVVGCLSSNFVFEIRLWENLFKPSTLHTGLYRLRAEHIPRGERGILAPPGHPRTRHAPPRSPH